MAITVNAIKMNEHMGHNLPSSYGFQATISGDVNFLEDPRVAGKQVISRGVSIDAAEALAVTFVDETEAVIPAGALAAGIIHPIRIIRVLETGTGATVNVWIWL